MPARRQCYIRAGERNGLRAPPRQFRSGSCRWIPALTTRTTTIREARKKAGSRHYTTESAPDSSPARIPNRGFQGQLGGTLHRQVSVSAVRQVAVESLARQLSAFRVSPAHSRGRSSGTALATAAARHGGRSAPAPARPLLRLRVFNEGGLARPR